MNLPDDALLLFNDTETTGFPSGTHVHDKQARVCQIALMLTDMSGRPLCQFSTLIKPDGWTVGEGAQKVHGFSTEQCEKYGLHFRSVFSLYARMASMATVIIAHNSDFDNQMMQIEQNYYNASTIPNAAHASIVPLNVDKPWLCTMKPNTNIVKAPNKNGKSGYKWPSLEEALQFFCQRKPTHAHDAVGDVTDCRDIFIASRKNAA